MFHAFYNNRDSPNFSRGSYSPPLTYNDAEINGDRFVNTPDATRIISYADARFVPQQCRAQYTHGPLQLALGVNAVVPDKSCFPTNKCDTSIVERLVYAVIGRGGGLLDIMLGRSRMTTHPRIPTMPGHSTPGFHRPGRQCSHYRSAVRCSASYIKSELHPTEDRS